jgi:hypothetical protein
MIAANDEQHSPQKNKPKDKIKLHKQNKKHIQPQKKTHPNM